MWLCGDSCPLLVPTECKTGRSGYGFQVVSWEPTAEQRGLVRFSLLFALAASGVVTVVLIMAWLRESGHYRRRLTRRQQSILDRNQFIAKLLVATVVVSNILFCDKLFRPVEYFTPVWIHRGLFLVGDLTVVCWLLPTAVALFCGSVILAPIPRGGALRGGVPANGGSLYGAEECSFHWALLHLYCAALWLLTAAHFVTAPIADYRSDTRIVVICQAFVALALQFYVLYAVDLGLCYCGPRYYVAVPNTDSDTEMDHQSEDHFDSDSDSRVRRRRRRRR